MKLIELGQDLPPVKTTAPDMRPIPAGSIFTITLGEFSSYQIAGVFRAAQDIDTTGLINEYLIDHPNNSVKRRFGEREFLGWLAQRKVLDPIETWEWHVGDSLDNFEMYVEKIDGVDECK